METPGRKLLRTDHHKSLELVSRRVFSGWRTKDGEEHGAKETFIIAALRRRKTRKCGAVGGLTHLGQVRPSLWFFEDRRVVPLPAS